MSLYLTKYVSVYSSVGKICSLLPYCKKTNKIPHFSLIIDIGPFTEHASIFSAVVACSYIKIFHKDSSSDTLFSVTENCISH
jgi:hypothetical protein